MKGAGTSAVTHKYQLTDVNENTGYTYYRLKQIDLDGSFEYSSIIAIKGAVVPLSVNAFPNPGQSKNITFKTTGLSVNDQLAVMVYDVRGRVIYTNENFAVTSDKQVFKLKLPLMPTGKYIVKMKGKNQVATASFVIIP